MVVTDVNETTACQTATAIGGGAIGLHTDVTSKESVQAMKVQAMYAPIM